MNIDLTSTTVTFAYETSGADPIQLRYGQARFDPQRVEITVQDGKATYAKVEGPNVKKDGSAGQNWHDQNYSLLWDSETKAIPEWLSSLVAQAERRYAGMQSAVTR